MAATAVDPTLSRLAVVCPPALVMLAVSLGLPGISDRRDSLLSCGGCCSVTVVGVDSDVGVAEGPMQTKSRPHFSLRTTSVPPLSCTVIVTGLVPVRESRSRSDLPDCERSNPFLSVDLLPRSPPSSTVVAPCSPSSSLSRGEVGIGSGVREPGNADGIATDEDACIVRREAATVACVRSWETGCGEAWARSFP